MSTEPNIFKHLLPKSRAWSLTIDKNLRRFFEGLTGVGDDSKAFFDNIFDELNPQLTGELAAWEYQFGLPAVASTEQERRDRLSAAWKALGGQSPRYLQDQIWAAGFTDVYLYESFFRLDVGAGYRKPWLYLDDGRFPDYIVAAGIMGEPGFEMGEPAALMAGFFNFGPIVSITQMGEPPMQMGEPDALLGNFRRLGELFTYPLPAGATVPDEAQSDDWPYILYWGGPPVLGQPTTAVVSKDREQEFKTLILKLSPAQQWHGLIIDFL